MSKEAKIKMRIVGETLVFQVPLQIIYKLPALSSPDLEIDFRIMSMRPVQLRVLDEMLHGNQNKEIADHMNISISGVKYHITQILKRLGVSNRTELFCCLRGKRIEQLDVARVH